MHMAVRAMPLHTGYLHLNYDKAIYVPNERGGIEVGMMCLCSCLDLCSYSSLECEVRLSCCSSGYLGMMLFTQHLRLPLKGLEDAGTMR